MATKQNITIVKGDSYRPTLSIDNYVPSSSDTITFTVKEKSTDSTALLTKTFTADSMVLNIEAGDTSSFPANGIDKWIHGKYMYEARITYSVTISGTAKTNKETFLYGDFILLKEVA